MEDTVYGHQSGAVFKYNSELLAVAGNNTNEIESTAENTGWKISPIGPVPYYSSLAHFTSLTYMNSFYIFGKYFIKILETVRNLDSIFTIYIF